MLRFLYGFPYALDKTPADDTQQTWERHLNVAIVADKYDLPDLEKFAFDACTVDIRNRDSQDVDVSHLIKRAADYHDRSGALSGVTLGVVNAQFVSLFPKTDVQAWLADRPEDREALMVSHFDELMKTETFREMLRTDGEMALRHLDRLHSEAGHRGDDCKSEADDAFWGLYGKKEKKARKKLRHQGEVGSNDGYDAWP